MEPLVLVDGQYSASLDGITLAGDLILEIKCPMKGRDSDLWKGVELGQVPEYYGWQIEHQLMVAGAKLAHLWVFDGTQGLLLEVAARPKRWQEIHSAWDGFMKYLESDNTWQKARHSCFGVGCWTHPFAELCHGILPLATFIRFTSTLRNGVDYLRIP